MTQQRLFVFSFFLLLTLVFLQLVGVFRLFLTPILWAVILSLVFHPLYLRCLALFRNRKNIAALTITLLVIIVTAAPMIYFSGTLVREVISFYQGVGEWIARNEYQVLWDRFLHSPLKGIWDAIVEKTEALNIQWLSLIGKGAQQLSQLITSQIQSGAKNFLFFVINYLITMTILFFFLRDGHSLASGLKTLFPMTSENKEAVFKRLSDTVEAVVQGLVVTGVIQAILGGLAFWILGVPYPLFLSLMVGFVALVPIGGAVLVWLPSAIYLSVSGHWGKGIILFLWGALVISMVDNFVKPLLIGEKTKLPMLFLFLSIVGGLSFYGLIGVFLSPVMLGLFMTLLEIYKKGYSEKS